MRRHERQAALDAGERPDFLAATREIRESAWTVAPAPADFDDRRVEITGPAEPKMMINALNSGARVFMADLEDALSPTWANVVGGQAALMDAVRGTLTFDSPEGKSYRLGDTVAQLVVRPRGWHLVESHVMVDDVPISASLFDAGLYLFHNAAERVARGSGPYLYLPKLESHHEARLWNEVFVHAQEALGVPRGQRPGDRPDRDHHRGLRDGRDPVRAARARRGPQRRPLGLPVQRDQEVPRLTRAVEPRPLAADDDPAVHARLHRAAGRRPATSAAPTRSAGWRRSSRTAATPR